MKLPPVPTDNLYKFYSISGFIILIYSSYMAHTSYTDVLIELEKLRVLDVYNKIYETELSQSIDNSLSFIKEKVQVEKSKADIQIRGRDLINNAHKMPWITIAFIITAVFGSVLSWRGIALWRIKTQVYLDTILKLTAKRFQDKEVIKIDVIGDCGFVGHNVYRYSYKND